MMLVGCNAKNENTENSDGKNITLRWWTDPRFVDVVGYEDETPNRGDWDKILAKQFMDKHPNVTIKVEVLIFNDMLVKVSAAIAAGNPPDILRDGLARTPAYYHQGALENMNDLFWQNICVDVCVILLVELHLVPLRDDLVNAVSRNYKLFNILKFTFGISVCIIQLNDKSKMKEVMLMMMKVKLGDRDVEMGGEYIEQLFLHLLSWGF